MDEQEEQMPPGPRGMGRRGLPSDPLACALSARYLLGPVISNFDPGVLSGRDNTWKSAGIQKLLVVVSSLSPARSHV